MPKKTPPKSALYILFFIIMGLAFFIMWGRQLPFDSKVKKDTAEKAVQKVGPVYSLEPLVEELAGRYLKVTKAEEGKRPRIGSGKKYLKIALDLELKDENTAEELGQRLAQIRAAVLEIVSSKKVTDIEGVEGKKALSDEIAGQLNRILQEDIVTDVFFAEFIIQ